MREKILYEQFKHKYDELIINNDDDSYEEINKHDKKIAEYLNAIKCEFYNENKLTIDIYQDLQKYLKEKKTFEIKYEIFNQITDIIYEKLFGTTSSLYLFFLN